MGTEKKGMMKQLEMNLKIDPELQNVLPPLTDAEFKALEELILSDGRVNVPLDVWNGTIVDGHNRYKIIQKHPEIPWSIREVTFSNKWEAIDWMCSNQLGRRNLSDEMKTYAMGKQYEARKHTSPGNPTLNRNADGTFQRDQNGHNGHGRIKEQIAKEQNVGQGTVQRAEYYAHGIDAIREEDPELADSILKSDKKVIKKDIQTIGTAKPEEQKQMIQAVKEGRRVVSKPEAPKEVKKESEEEKQKRREEMMAIREVKEKLFSAPVQIEYTIDSLLHDIEINASPFIRLFRQIAEENKKVCASNKETVIKALHENITMKIEELEKEIENYEL